MSRDPSRGQYGFPDTWPVDDDEHDEQKPEGVPAPLFWFTVAMALLALGYAAFAPWA